MTDPYHIDLEDFELEKFRKKLETGELLPGRRILKEKIAQRFQTLESKGIKNLKDLWEALKTKRRVERFSEETGLPQDYLVILRREVNSYMPKPANLKDIPGVNPQHIERLAAVGVKHTKHLFERARSRDDRIELSRLANVPGDDLLELVRLSDLVRIGGVGPVFARIIFDAGIDTLEKLSSSAPDKLFEELLAINRQKQYTRADFTVKDVQHCINMARQLPKAIEY